MLRRTVRARVTVAADVEVVFQVSGEMPTTPLGGEGSASLDEAFLQRAAEEASERLIRLNRPVLDMSHSAGWVEIVHTEGERSVPAVSDGQGMLDVGEEPGFQARWEALRGCLDLDLA